MKLRVVFHKNHPSVISNLLKDVNEFLAVICICLNRFERNSPQRISPHWNQGVVRFAEIDTVETVPYFGGKRIPIPTFSIFIQFGFN
jgi:hypothetical protein